MMRRHWEALVVMLSVVAVAIGSVHVLKHWNPPCKRFEIQEVETYNSGRFRDKSMPLTTVHKIKVCVER